MRTLVVLPTYNEVETIVEVLKRIRDATPAAEVLVVDDDSPDGTADKTDAAGAELGGIHVLRRGGRLGFGAAYRAGFGWGLARGFDTIVQMDADLSHDPAVLPSLLIGLADHDLVIGSRYVRGGSLPDWTMHRRLLSRAGNWYSSRALGLRVQDVTAGYRAYRAQTLRTMDLDSVRADGYGFQIEMTYRAAQVGSRITEVPICFVDRQLGKSKMSGAIIVEALLLVTRWGIARGLSRLPRLRMPVARSFRDRADSGPSRLLMPIANRLDAVEGRLGMIEARLSALEQGTGAVEAGTQIVGARAATVREQSLVVIESDARISRRIERIERLLEAPARQGQVSQ
jgi:dolichol-phosphate mannosyltransferase